MTRSDCEARGGMCWGGPAPDCKAPNDCCCLGLECKTDADCSKYNYYACVCTIPENHDAVIYVEHGCKDGKCVYKSDKIVEDCDAKDTVYCSGDNLVTVDYYCETGYSYCKSKTSTFDCNSLNEKYCLNVRYLEYKDYYCDSTTLQCNYKTIQIDCFANDYCDSQGYFHGFQCSNNECIEIDKICSYTCCSKLDGCYGVKYRDYLCINLDTCDYIESCSKACGAVCESDADCPEGSRCNIETCNCVGGQCNYNGICEPGEDCSNCPEDCGPCESCTDECSSGAKRCYGNVLQECKNCDADACLEWCTIEDCNARDGWYNRGNPYSCCSGLRICTCQDQEYRDYYCDSSTTSCKYQVTSTRTIKSNCRCSKACGAVCESDADCPTNYVCNLTTCECEYRGPEYTSISIEPKYTFPGDEVTLTIEIYSSKYKREHDIYFAITIDGEEWNNTYCKIAFKRLDMSKCMKDENYKKQHNIQYITSQDGYFKIVATCTIPPSISPGTHILLVEPHTWSELVKLPTATTSFVTYKMISLFELLLNYFSSLFK